MQRLDVALPEWTQRAIARDLAAYAGSSLRLGATDLTTAYRDKLRMAPGAVDPAAYLAMRAPATYAAIISALSALAHAAPNFAPASMLDAGAGPGTASWAALSAYPGIARATLIEAAHTMRAAGMTMSADAPPPLANAQWQLADIRTASLPDADLVTAAYVLNEMALHDTAQLAGKLYAAAQVLVLIEPGSRAGFERLRMARTALLDSGARILAPCTHALACPIAGDDWCHFSVRVPRTQLHRQAKGARLSYEDEKFSYLIASKPGAVEVGGATAARIIRHPVMRSGHAHLDLCAEGKICRHTVTRSDEDWRDARKAGWGDLWPGE